MAIFKKNVLKPAGNDNLEKNFILHHLIDLFWIPFLNHLPLFVDTLFTWICTGIRKFIKENKGVKLC